MVGPPEFDLWDFGRCPGFSECHAGVSSKDLLITQAFRKLAGTQEYLYKAFFILNLRRNWQPERELFSLSGVMRLVGDVPEDKGEAFVDKP